MLLAYLCIQYYCIILTHFVPLYGVLLLNCGVKVG